MHTKSIHRTNPSRVIAWAGACALGFAALGAQAAVVTWTGDTNLNWRVPGNWTPSGAPGAGDSASVGAGAVVSVNTNATVENLSLDGQMGINNRFTAQTVSNQGRLSVQRRGTLVSSALSNAAGATFNVGSSAQVDVLDNAGTVAVGRRQTLTTQTFDQSAGSTLLYGTIAGDVRIGAGLLSANGTIDGNLDVAADGVVTIGSHDASAGQLAVDGDAVLAGLTTFNINGTDDFDRIAVDGSVELGGTISLDFGIDFEPVRGMEFDLITAGTVLGAFDSFEFTEIDGFSFGFDNRGDRLTLTISGALPTVAAVPLPPSVWMFLAAACCAIAIGRRSEPEPELGPNPA